MRAMQTVQTVAMVGAVVVSGVIAWAVIKKGKSIAEAAGQVLDQINPVNPSNVVNRAANNVFQAVTGNQVDTIGTAARGWWEKMTGQEYDPNAPAKTAGDLPLTSAWTVADQEDAEAGIVTRGIQLVTPLDIEDAEAGTWKMTDTAGGASLNYTLARPYKRAKGF